MNVTLEDRRFSSMLLQDVGAMDVAVTRCAASIAAEPGSKEALVYALRTCFTGAIGSAPIGAAAVFRCTTRSMRRPRPFKRKSIRSRKDWAEDRRKERSMSISVICTLRGTPEQHELLKRRAQEAYLSLNQYILAIAGLSPGVCRVCGCSDESACEGGCAWADETHTLCTPCAAFVTPRSQWALAGMQRSGPDDEPSGAEGGQPQ